MTTPNNQPNDTYELPEDLFGRETIAEKIKGLLESDIDLSPMVIDGDWGIGKTVFCHRLINKINESQQLNCVYIDAFRADHIDDPLISIISEIGKLVEKNGDEGKLDSFIDGAKPFLRTAAKTLGKAALSYTLRQSTADITKDYEKEIEALAGVSIDASIDLIIRDKINAEKNLDTLHDALKEVTKEKELIILIDELDRCRATFAIDMLETIKHAFSIPKVKIVIVTNASHLETAFRHRYGSNNDTKNYFEKFYKYKYQLPKSKLKYQNGSQTYSNEVINSYKYFIRLLRDSNTMRDIIRPNLLDKEALEILIKNIDLSLRDMELIKNDLEIVNLFNDDLLEESSTKIFYSIIAIIIFKYDPEYFYREKKSHKREMIKRYLGVDDKKGDMDKISAISYILANDEDHLVKSLQELSITEGNIQYIENHFIEVFRCLSLE